MAMNRMNQAKGALIHLLAKAYLHRDQVALVSFRGRQASVLLAPTRSVDLAKRAVDALPAGGGTPLAAGLESALNLALRARPAGRETLLVLLSDGRANVPRNPGPGGREAVWRDVEQVCAAMRAERVNSVVIDTTHQSVSNGEAGRIAELLGGRLVHLPHPKPDAVCAAVSAAVEAARALEPVG
jgi:magnesium chelatase subunit D